MVTNSHLKNQLQYKDQMKKAEKDMKPFLVQTRLQIEEKMKKDLEEQKKKKLDKMSVYRETLEYQQ
jgi:hypothetical protein